MRRRWSLSAIASTLSVVSSIFILVPSASADFEIPQGRIAYVTTVNGHKAIFVIDPANNSDNRSLVDLGDRDASQPAWAFDGARIAFTAETSPGGPKAIYVANADGSGIEQVTSPASGESDSDASWSPGGDEIAFARSLPTGLSGILIVDVNTLALRALDFPSLPTASQPDWSPEGSRIAFVAKRYIGSPTCDTDPQLCHWTTFVTNADGSGTPQQVGGNVFDHHDPDWSADATRIATSAGLDPDPPFMIVALGPLGEGPLPGSTEHLSQPSWSPYRHGLVATFASGSQSMIVIYSEAVGTFTFLIASASEPAWGAVPEIPPIPPPPFETSPPTIEFSTRTNDQGWLTDPRVGVIARDQTGVSIICHLDDSFIPIDIASRSSEEVVGSVELSGATEGQHVLRCWATDGWSNLSSKALALSIDFTAPRLGQASVNPHLTRVDQTAILTVPFEEHGSGLSSATVRLESSEEGPSFPMTASGSNLTATIGPSVPAGIWSPVVDAIDNNGNASSRNYFNEFLVVYDPQAGSASGTGWIIPGGATSDIYDHLSVGLDGKTKASFSFKAQYESAASTSPTGFFNLSYGSQFKLQSAGLDWLLVSTATAEFQGTATIKGLPGTFVFQVTVKAGGSTYPADHLELRVWQTGADPFRDRPKFQATGDAGGKIQIEGRDA